MVHRVLDEGQPIQKVAIGFSIRERTARKRLARYRAKRPHRAEQPLLLRMELLRREYRLTAEEITGKLTLAHSTTAAWLTQRGLCRRRDLRPKESPQRYQGPFEMFIW
jgi:hypothetical protein